jgi:hypothetical protein
MRKKTPLARRILSGLIGFALIIFAVLFFIQRAQADEMVHKFKSPSFNGMGTSAHYLTIENQETSRKNKIKEDLQTAIDEAKREAENSTLARFLKNFESRVYSQLSRDLVDQLFGSDGQGLEAYGTVVLEGNTIEYTSDGVTITLKITDADGNVTEITIPIGSFGDFMP